MVWRSKLGVKDIESGIDEGIIRPKDMQKDRHKLVDPNS
jgi:hypothetical protein